MPLDSANPPPAFDGSLKPRWRPTAGWVALAVVVALIVVTLLILSAQPHGPSSLAADEPSQLKFSDELAALQYNNGALYTRIHRDSLLNSSPLLFVPAWWLFIACLGWLTWPLLFAALPGLHDRGYAFAKLVGLLLVSWPAWYAASLRVPLWNQAGLMLVVVGVAFVSGVVGWKQRAALLAFFRARWRRLLAVEALTLALFLLGLAVRLLNPDLWQSVLGNEQPMDFAYFNGVLRSTVFPPIDPWYAGGYLNYYYFGFVIYAAPVLLLGFVPSVAYNLIVATLFAFTGLGAFSVAFHLTSALNERQQAAPEQATPKANPWLAGFAAILLAVVLGNLDATRLLISKVATLGGYDRNVTLQQFLSADFIDRENRAPTGEETAEIEQRAARNDPIDRIRFEAANTSAVLQTSLNGVRALLAGERIGFRARDWLWEPTRVYAVPPLLENNGLTEMPAFPFINGDFHPHVVSLPLQLLVLALLLAAVLHPPDAAGSRLLLVLITGLVVGLFRAVNTWEWPVYSLLTLSVYGFIAFKRYAPLARVLLWSALFGLVSLFVALPFAVHYKSIYGGVRWWDGYHTQALAFLDVFGLFLFLLVSFLIWETTRWRRDAAHPASRAFRTTSVLGLMVAVAVGLALLFLGYGVPIVVLPLLAWLAILFFRPGQSPVIQFMLLLVAFALCETLGVEFVALLGDEGRQNTVGKLYLHVWLILSVTGSAGLALLASELSSWPAGRRRAWKLALGLLVGIAAVFPVATLLTRANHREAPDTPLTFDGLAFLQTAVHGEGNPAVIEANPAVGTFGLSEDLALIHWLQDHDAGASVVLEAVFNRPYHWVARISAFTGSPTVLGWGKHQSQQRTLPGMYDTIIARLRDVNRFYNTTDIPEAVTLLQRYQVDYVVVGRLERAYYPAEGLQKLADMARQGWLEVAFQAGESTLYRVVAPTDDQPLFTRALDHVAGLAGAGQNRAAYRLQDAL